MRIFFRGFLPASLVLVCLSGSGALADEAETAGLSAGGEVRGTWGTPEALSKGLSKPLLTGTAPITTLDASASGIAQIACSGTETLFSILVQPSATNDLNLVSIAYDADLDGAFDGRLVVNAPVSGVCANGFISCAPGTWSDCRWYGWRFSNGTLSYNEVAPGDLGGCYCINSGCSTAAFWAMKDQVLRNLAGGVAAAMAAENQRLAASKAEIEDLVIRYYGEDSGDCTVSDGPFSGFRHTRPEDLYRGSFLLNLEGEAEVASQASDPASLYGLVTHSSAFTNAGRRTCTIVRDVFFDPSSCEMREAVSDRCAALKNEPACRLETEVVFDANDVGTATYLDFSPTGVIPLSSCRTIDSEVIEQCALQDLGAAGFIPSGIQSCGENCLILVFGETGNNYWGGSCTRYEGLHSLYVRYPEAIESATLTRASWDDYIQVFVNNEMVLCGPDHCSDPRSLPSDGAPCERDRTWDRSPNIDLTELFRDEGRVDVRARLVVDGAGELYLAIRILLDPEPRYPVCYDWWRIERTYLCEDAAALEPDVERADAVTESLSEREGGFTFEDPVTGAGAIEMEIGEGETCLPACKLRTVNEAAQAAVPATSADFRNDPTSRVFIYRTCLDDICPTGPGEEVVAPCRCLSEFDLAYGVMESLRQAAVDMTCSDGTKKP